MKRLERPTTAFGTENSSMIDLHSRSNSLNFEKSEYNKPDD
jgi:hypothetical protein